MPFVFGVRLPICREGTKVERGNVHPNDLLRCLLNELRGNGLVVKNLESQLASIQKTPELLVKEPLLPISQVLFVTSGRGGLSSVKKEEGPAGAQEDTSTPTVATTTAVQKEEPRKAESASSTGELADGTPTAAAPTDSVASIAAGNPTPLKLVDTGDTKASSVTGAMSSSLARHKGKGLKNFARIADAMEEMSRKPHGRLASSVGTVSHLPRRKTTLTDVLRVGGVGVFVPCGGGPRGFRLRLERLVCAQQRPVPQDVDRRGDWPNGAGRSGRGHHLARRLAAGRSCAFRPRCEPFLQVNAAIALTSDSPTNPCVYISSHKDDLSWKFLTSLSGYDSKENLHARFVNTAGADSDVSSAIARIKDQVDHPFAHPDSLYFNKVPPHSTVAIAFLIILLAGFRSGLLDVFSTRLSGRTGLHCGSSKRWHKRFTVREEEETSRGSGWGGLVSGGESVEGGESAEDRARGGESIP